MRQNLAIYQYDNTLISSLFSKKSCYYMSLPRPILPYAILNAIQFCDVTDLNYCSTTVTYKPANKIVHAVHNLLHICLSWFLKVF